MCNGGLTSDTYNMNPIKPLDTIRVPASNEVVANVVDASTEHGPPTPRPGPARDLKGGATRKHGKRHH